MRYTTPFSIIFALIGITFSIVGLTIQSAIKVHLPKSSQPPYCIMFDTIDEIYVTINEEQKIELRFSDKAKITHSFQYKSPEQNTVSTEVSLWQQKHKRADVIVLADKSLSFPLIRDILYSLKITKIHKVHFIVRS